jgi:branched-chain amino acid transport system permease protein
MAAVRQQISERFGEGISLFSVLLWLIRIAVVVIVLWGSIATLRSEVYSLSQWKDLMVSGLSQGSIYGLIALGYTMVYGVLRFINFAHGEIFMSGAMIGFFVATWLDDAGIWTSASAFALLLVFLASIFTAAGITLVLERVAYRPLRSPATGPADYIYRGLFFSPIYFPGSVWWRTESVSADAHVAGKSFPIRVQCQ